MKKQTIVERSSSTTSYAGVVVAVLSVLCAIPAMVIGYVNRPMLTAETLSKPFKQPKESGAAYTEKAPVIDEALTIPEVVIDGVLVKIPNRAAPPQKTDKKAPVVIETPEVNVIGTTTNEDNISTTETGGAAWMQDSRFGGTVKITGFEPGE